MNLAILQTYTLKIVKVCKPGWLLLFLVTGIRFLAKLPSVTSSDLFKYVFFAGKKKHFLFRKATNGKTNL